MQDRVLAGVKRTNQFIVECRRGGKLRWSAHVPHNLVPSEGLSHGVTSEFKGAAYTAAWYIGLTDASPTFAAADTMAAHGGWAEVTAYTETGRQVLTLGAVSAGVANNYAAPGTYSINAATTVGGAFICTHGAPGSANGTIGGEGAFAEGNKTVGSGDALSVRVLVQAGAG